MLICFEKYSSVINLDLLWKQVFSHTYRNKLEGLPLLVTSILNKHLQARLEFTKVEQDSALKGAAYTSPEILD
jgi:hypothetical protein